VKKIGKKRISAASDDKRYVVFPNMGIQYWLQNKKDRVKACRYVEAGSRVRKVVGVVVSKISEERKQEVPVPRV